MRHSIEWYFMGCDYFKGWSSLFVVWAMVNLVSPAGYYMMGVYFAPFHALWILAGIWFVFVIPIYLDILRFIAWTRRRGANKNRSRL